MLQRFTRTRIPRDIRPMGVIAGTLLLTTLCGAQSFQVIHTFQGTEGSEPYGGPMLSGSTLYGMTVGGGTLGINGPGTIYSLNTDGSGFKQLHSFTGISNDGATPMGSLIESGTMLYGMTEAGGQYSRGTVFRMRSDGTGFVLLHSFNPTTDGNSPAGSLVQLGETLYGMTNEGPFSGTTRLGTIFSVSTNGTNFTLLHTFTDDPLGSSDGSRPLGSLLASGSTLYGMTGNGGDYGHGAIFKINADGTGYQIIHSFGSTASDGAYPNGSLIQLGERLFGVTSGGGTTSQGAIFSLNPDGTGYQVLHSFTGTSSGYPPDAQAPTASLFSLDGRLYGVTSLGLGSPGNGTIFSIAPDGTDYRIEYAMDHFIRDGYEPFGGLTGAGNVLYGVNASGGADTQQGTIFSFAVPEPSFLAATCLSALLLLRRRT